jgi:hypothetical protein
MDRFWSKVDKFGPIVQSRLGRCWVWTGAKTDKGYGRLHMVGGVEYAHRISWNHHFGYTKKWVLHRCDNSSCVRPTHLFLGTCADNNADMVRKGRQCRGEDRPQSKLTRRSVAQIRRLRGKISQRVLALRYGVDQSTISLAQRGLNWKND